MDPPATTARNPLPQVPILARAEISLKATDLYDGSLCDEHAMDDRDTRTSEPLKRVFLDSRIAPNGSLTAIGHDPAIVAIGGHRRGIRIQRSIHPGKERTINPVITVQEQYSF